MLVSIISAVYNGEKYLDEFFESIIHQSHTEWELLIVNDGSTDESGNVIAKWEKQDSRIFGFTQGNKGLSKARNVGLDHCNGDYIVFVDSDDYIDRDYLKRMLEKQVETNADIVVCNFSKVFVNAIIPDTRMPKEEKSFTSADMLERLYIYPACYAVVWNRLYCRKIFQELRFTEGIINEDADLMIRLFDEDLNIIYIPDRLYFYRRRASGITGAVTDRLVLSNLKWMKLHMDWHQRKEDNFLYVRASKLYVYTIAENYKFLSRETKQTVKKDLKKYGRLLIGAKETRKSVKLKIAVMVVFPQGYSKYYNRKVKTNNKFFE